MRTNKLTTIEQICFCLASVVLMSLVALVVAGCGGNNNNGGDMGGGGSADMAGGGCVANPMTHLEIINACTDSQSVDITPFYPAAAPNGVLPALP
jgi:hypothetical protein